ncbi:bestrophin-like domain [Mycobacterium angelicum]|uniref:DUF4239 domain-containing protein n=1 Tax=Mycobacterium angelicum TaxID=470074 RepID=A0A1W9ZAU6_MYCAN|nr:DUF4239 domain-containing protein [Mycobacterium angelicum]MCV7196765.1 DUF4239 domain-containing protein [Mycobacterium angelicum]ORA10772.1 hypothetical protein BST12_26430 [Mycobacterium angelicum]
MARTVLPLWLLLTAAVFLAILIAVGWQRVATRTLSEVGDRHNSNMAPFITVVGLVYSALLGFTVVFAWQQFSATGVVVSHEASTLTTLYRQTAAMPEPERTELRKQLRTYAGAVMNSEWEVQSGGGTDEGARFAITEMYVSVGTQPTGVVSGPIQTAFLSQLTVLATDRTTRILDARSRIPGVMWLGLMFGGIVIVALAGFLRLGSTLGHAILSSSIAVLLSLLMCIAYSFDHPFANELGITPAPFQHAVQVFGAIDQEH